MRDLLPEYAAGSLPAERRRKVTAHLASCAACRTELAGWTAVADAAATAGPPPPAAAVVRAALSRAALSPGALSPGALSPAGLGDPTDLDRPAVRPGPRRLPPALVAAEIRLIRPAVLLASLVVMALGVALSLARPATGWTGRAGDVLALFAPLVAAAGVAGVYGPRHDPVAELTATTPTSARLIVLIRVTLVFGYDLLLALAASVVLAAAGAATDGLDTLIGAWLGPMALLTAVGLVVAAWWGTDAGMGTALALCGVRVLADSSLIDAAWPARAVAAVWTTNLPVLAAAGVLAAAALLLVGRGEPWRPPRATHPV